MYISEEKIAPLVITCGDPAGVGPEVAISAWKALREAIPICLIIDPKFLPENINIKIVDQPPATKDFERTTLTIIKHDFSEIRLPASQIKAMLQT